MDLGTRYREALDQYQFSADDAQLRAVAALERVRSGLIADQPPVLGGRLERLLRIRPRPPVLGVYLWGGVGRGKTFLMDMFFESLPFERKLRQHFHRMMYRVHGQLAALGNRRDPLEIVADDLAAQARVICFDEFFVSEIGDAMILGRLLDALFRRRVTLVATSNIPPGELYRGGLQRERFAPAIELLKRHTEIVKTDAGTDYRLRVLAEAGTWHSPLDATAAQSLARYYGQMAPEAGARPRIIEVHGRELETVRRADGIAWFTFKTLCGGPRGADDYIELARSFQTVILEGIPPLGADNDDQARRFVALIDEFYDRRVKLVASSAVPIGELYTGRRLAREFERTQSRLREMQSHRYLTAAHVP